MKICTIICEFNPFHNGHKYLIDKAKELSGCDLTLCIMSGSFTQRGDIAVLDKFTRARHAVLSGADCVIELPAPFAVAPAEIFAKGAIKILGSIPDVTAIAFGCETPTDFLQVADNLKQNEAKFDTSLKRNLAAGESYAKSYALAYAECGGDGDIFTPNNILAIEYAKAVLASKNNIQLIPVKRIGGGYNDNRLKDNFSSASAIRANLNDNLIKNNVPTYVFADLQSTMRDITRWQNIIRYSLLTASTDKLRDIYGCSEGLENKLKSLANLSVEEIIESATGKRYPSSRIRRILAANALNLSKSKTDTYLLNSGYIKPLAVNANNADKILAALAKSKFPVVIKQRELNGLDELSREMFESSSLADGVWQLAHNKNFYDFTLSIV